MKIRWREQYSKTCWEIRTPKNFPMARIIKENDIPTLMEYNVKPIDGKITLMREREGEISNWEQIMYWRLGYRTIHEIIQKKYNLGRRYF